jgi:hypothetical protein
MGSMMFPMLAMKEASPSANICRRPAILWWTPNVPQAAPAGGVMGSSWLRASVIAAPRCSA